MLRAMLPADPGCLSASLVTGHPDYPAVPSEASAACPLGLEPHTGVLVRPASLRWHSA